MVYTRTKENVSGARYMNLGKKSNARMEKSVKIHP